MINQYEKRLHTAVEAFKAYQREIFPNMTEENDNGEWVFGDEFDAMCNAYLEILQNVSVDDADKALLDDMLYTVARDNECSHLMTELLRHPQWFASLCNDSLETGHVNARWQFAEHLHEYLGKKEIVDLIFKFIESGDEYTERMALQSLVEIYPHRAEEYALKFWNRKKYAADEYQKIMALYALDKVNSLLLEEYLTKAENTEYVYLKHYASELRR